MLKSVFKNNNVEAFYNAENGTYVLKHKFQKGVAILTPEKIRWVLTRYNHLGQITRVMWIDYTGEKFAVIRHRYAFSKTTVRVVLALMFECTGHEGIFKYLLKYNKK